MQKKKPSNREREPEQMQEGDTERGCIQDSNDETHIAAGCQLQSSGFRKGPSCALLWLRCAVRFAAGLFRQFEPPRVNLMFWMLSEEMGCSPGFLFPMSPYRIWRSAPPRAPTKATQFPVKGCQEQKTELECVAVNCGFFFRSLAFSFHRPMPAICIL